MVWKSGDREAMIMEDAKGFAPYTGNNNQSFYYDLKSSDRFNQPDYKLPALEEFEKLKSYFDADPNFSPFSQDFYAQEDFCFAVSPDNQ